MTNISEIVKTWPKNEYGWSIAPEGLDWIKAGAWIKVGDGARIGSYVSIGDGARIGSYTRIGNGASIGNGARIGDYARIGGDASIGNGASIGPNSTEAIDIGFADGYRKCIANVKGVAYIGAGCRWFTLTEAIKHWSAKADERELTLCLLESAKSIARLKGWAFEE